MVAARRPQLGVDPCSEEPTQVNRAYACGGEMHFCTDDRENFVSCDFSSAEPFSDHGINAFGGPKHFRDFKWMCCATATVRELNVGNPDEETQDTKLFPRESRVSRIISQAKWNKRRESKTSAPENLSGRAGIIGTELPHPVQINQETTIPEWLLTFQTFHKKKTVNAASIGFLLIDPVAALTSLKLETNDNSHDFTRKCVPSCSWHCKWPLYQCQSVKAPP